jgi:hypothetical protein
LAASFVISGRDATTLLDAFTWQNRTIGISEINPLAGHDADMPKSTRMTRSRHIEFSKTVALAYAWGCRGMGRAFGFAFLPIRLVAISFKPLLALTVLLTGAYGAVAAISNWRVS